MGMQPIQFFDTAPVYGGAFNRMKMAYTYSPTLNMEEVVAGTF